LPLARERGPGENGTVNRRGFLKGTIAAPALPLAAAPGPEDVTVDTCVYLSRWPFRRLAGDDAAELAAMLGRHGAASAWAGSFDALLHKDLSGSNERLARECRERGRGVLVPFGSVNPKLPDWEEDLRRCHEELKMRGIRLHPNYQNYSLDDPDFERLLRAAAERGLLVQIACWMDDERHHHPLMMVPPVNTAPLPGVLERVPKARVVLSNAFHIVGSGNKVLAGLRQRENVAVDFARTDALMELRRLIDALGIGRVVFGSHLPLFYFESAALKMREIELTAAETAAIRRGNARRLLGS
jgi:uncharacterized protein